MPYVKKLAEVLIGYGIDGGNFIAHKIDSESNLDYTDWVVKTANILNVIYTRAKYQIAFMGNFDEWKNWDFIPEWIDKIDVIGDLCRKKKIFFVNLI